MRVEPLSSLKSVEMRNLLREERYEWNRQLNWDYSESQRIIAGMLETRTLPGFVAVEENQCVGYVFYLDNSGKGLLGACFVSSRYQGREIENLLLSKAIEALKSDSAIQRIESQFISLSEWRIRDCFSLHEFECFERIFMIRSSELDPIAPSPEPFEIRQWSAGDLGEAAGLTVEAYKEGVDRRITFHYQSEPECRRFLENLILRPGCGIFLPEAAFSAVDRSSGRLLGYVLSSRISHRDGHIPQIVVAVDSQGRGIGSALLRRAIRKLGLSGCTSTSLSVSQANLSAVRLYQKLGFVRRVQFPTFVWERSGSSAIPNRPRSMSEDRLGTN